MEYKLLNYKTYSYGEVNVSSGQTAFRWTNPAVDADLTSYARDGWRVVQMSNSQAGYLFILLER